MSRRPEDTYLNPEEVIDAMLLAYQFTLDWYVPLSRAQQAWYTDTIAHLESLGRRMVAEAEVAAMWGPEKEA